MQAHAGGSEGFLKTMRQHRLAFFFVNIQSPPIIFTLQPLHTFSETFKDDGEGSR
jgi:hypothetical protein